MSISLLCGIAQVGNAQYIRLKPDTARFFLERHQRAIMLDSALERASLREGELLSIIKEDNIKIESYQADSASFENSLNLLEQSRQVSLDSAKIVYDDQKAKTNKWRFSTFGVIALWGLIRIFGG